MDFFAHSDNSPEQSCWQKLDIHLNNVASLSELFASSFNSADWGRAAGLLHDSGKATQEFTERLEGKPVKVNHSIFGARLGKEIGGRLGQILSYVIAGHHGGLPNGGMQEGQLHYRLKYERVPADITLLPDLDYPKSLSLPFSTLPQHPGFSLALFTRMLFSCLTDADFLDTEAFCNPEQASLRAGSHYADMGNMSNVPDIADMAKLQQALHAHLVKLAQDAKPSRVNAIRQSVLADCRAKTVDSPGIFSLTVPTGGGKTYSSMAFALDHAVRHSMRRIIYAIPFTSIIEQNAQIFSKVLGRENVLEHHCNYVSKDTPEEQGYDKWRGLAAENWDAPVVVTTNVQLFESLFSNKPSRCRKLHNIARSVIVLDEAQAIPTDYLEPCLCAMQDLVHHYGCTVVLCTATQPAMDDPSLRTRLQGVREIISDPARLYADLKRTEVTFAGKLTDTELAERLGTHAQVLCIVSTKAQAQAMFNLLSEQEGTFHLSTNMYPAHRRTVLDSIRQRLKDTLTCRIVSTSLIEAGVDLDLPVVYRAMAGLDSIAQAAGRCNREGLNATGQVVVYEPESTPVMPWLQRCASRAGETLRTLQGEDPLGLTVMRRYFELLYDVQTLDTKQIVTRLNNSVGSDLLFPFKAIAQDFRFIEDEGTAVIIPRDPEAEALIQQLRNTQFPRTVLRSLQQYSVTVRSRDLAALRSSGAVELIHNTYPVLHNMTAYHDTVGLCVETAAVWDAEGLIC